jgi:hypothetical protein
MYGTFLRNLDGTPAVRLGDGNPDDVFWLAGPYRVGGHQRVMGPEERYSSEQEQNPETLRNFHGKSPLARWAVRSNPHPGLYL